MRKYLHLSILEWVIFISSLLAIILYAYILLSAPNLEKYVKDNEKHLNWLSYDEILEKVENGDLILLAGNTRGEKMCRWFPGSVFSHVGVLFWEKNKETGESTLFIWDSDLGQGYREGPRISLFKDKISRYKGCQIGALKKLKVDPPLKRPTSEEIMKLYPPYEDLEFDHLIATWFVADYPMLYNLFKKPKQIFCGEMVADILQQLGIMKKDRVPAWYVPGDFHRPDNRLHLEPGYSYTTTYFFRFPPHDTSDSEDEIESLISDNPEDNPSQESDSDGNLD